MLNVKIPRIDESLKFIAVFAIIYISATPLAGVYYIQWSIVAFLFFLLSFLFTRKVSVKRQLLLLYIIIAMLFLSTMFLTGDGDTNHYLGRIINLTTAFLFCQVLSKEEFEYWFCKIMCLLSVVSLVIYVIFNIVPSAVWSLPMIVGAGSGDTTRRLATIAYIHFFNVNGSHEVMDAAWAGADVTRNSGMFAEPGMYQVFLNFAIMICIVKLKNENDSWMQKKYLKMITLLGVTVCTTVSTTGIVVFICLLLSLIFSNKGRMAIKKAYHEYTFFKLLFPVVVVGFVFAIVLVAPTVFGKFSQNASNYGSYLTRTTNTFKDINAWLDSPLWGLGITQYETQFAGAENGITCSLACYGLPIVILAILGVYNYIKKGSGGGILLYFIGVIFSLSTQNIFFSLFLYVIYYYGFEKTEESYYEGWKDENSIG